MSEERFTKDDRVRPFSNGTEFLMWQERNCWRGCRSYRPTASSSRHGCPIEVALAMACCDDGTIAAKHALRGGFVEPAESGLFEYAEGDASTLECPEFRGSDDPGPPRLRRPRPPGDQLDLLDPREQTSRRQDAPNPEPVAGPGAGGR